MDVFEQAVEKLLGPETPEETSQRQDAQLERRLNEIDAQTQAPTIRTPEAETIPVYPGTARTKLAPVQETPPVEIPEQPIGLAKPEEVPEVGPALEAEKRPWATVPLLREQINPAWIDESLRAAIEVQRQGGAPDPLLPDWVTYTLKRIPFVGSVIEADQLMETVSSARRIQSGRPQALDFARVADFVVQEEKRAKGGWPRKVFDLITQLPAFGVEFAVTGGAYTAAKTQARKALIKLLRHRIRDEAVRALSVIPGATLQTLANPQFIARNVAYNLADDLEISTNDRNELQVMIQGDNDDFRSALTKALVQSGIEIASERAGIILEKPLAALKGAIARRWLTPGPGAGRTVAKLKETLRKAGWHGVLGEMFEERISEAAAPLYGKPWQLPSWSDLAAEAVAFSVPGAALAGARKMGKVTISAEERDAIDDFSRRFLEVAPILQEGDIYGHEEVGSEIESALFELPPGPHPSRDAFRRALLRTQAEHPYGSAVEVKPPEFYQDPRVKLFFSLDELAGAAISPEGELVSVFRHESSGTNIRRILQRAAPLAVSLTAFETQGFLPNLYAEFGFRPAARLEFNPNYAPANWNYNRDDQPDVVFMVRDPSGVTGLPDIAPGGYLSKRDHIPFFTDLDPAEAIQRAAIERVRATQAQTPARGPEQILPEPARRGKLKPEHRSVVSSTLATLLERHVPAERLATLRLDTIQGLARAFAAMPSVEELVRLARLGETGRHWYHLAAGVIRALAGPDHWRLAGLLAAASPNKGVWESIPIALKTYRMWVQADRPSDPARLRTLLYREPGSHQYGKPVYLEADLGNTLAILSSSSYQEAYSRMSETSPKVKPFYRALMGDLSAVVNDTIMGRIFGLSNVGQVMENLAATVWTREVARRLGWRPAEAQAAMWAAGRLIGDRIYHASRRKGNWPALRQILETEITAEDLFPRDDIASLLVLGYSTKEGRHYDFPKLVTEAGFSLEQGRRAYARLDAALLGRGPGLNARAALGSARASALGRRLERGYTGGALVLREIDDNPAPILAIAERRRKAQTPEEARQLTLALGQEIARRVPADLHRAAGMVGGPGTVQRGPIELYARLVAEEVIANGGTDLVGRSVADVHEAAVVFQTLRDPRFETVRWVFVKDGKIVGNYATTLRLPGVTYPFAWKEGLTDVIALAKSYQADGYYLVHNHPSGDPTPSDSDRLVTMRLAKAPKMPPYLGHVVINHQTYAVIDATGAVTGWGINVEEGKAKSYPRDLRGPDVMDVELDPLLLAPSKQPLGHFLQEKVSNKSELVRLVVALQQEREIRGIGLIFVDARNKVRGFGEMTVADFLRPDGPGHLRTTARGLGASKVLAYYGPPPGLGKVQGQIDGEVYNAMRVALSTGLVDDFLYRGLSFREHYGPPPMQSWMGINPILFQTMAERVAEENEPYIARERPRKFGQRVAGAPHLEPAVRAAGGAQVYQPIPNQVTFEQAQAIVQREGLVRSLDLIRDEGNGLPERVRVTLGEALIALSNRLYQTTGNVENLDLAITATRWLSEYGTRLGQGVQAFAIFNRLTPEGLVHFYRREVERVAQSRAAKKGLIVGPDLPSDIAKQLPQFDEKFAAEIMSRAQAAMNLPEGFQRQEAIMDILAAIAQRVGVSKWDVAIALWYANILSGWTTQARNFFGTLSHVIAEIFTHVVSRPSSLPDALIGLYQGFARGTADAWDALRTGKLTGTRIKKLEVPRVLELKRFKGPFYVLNAWKYVFRVMAASDMVFFRSAEEMKAHFLARSVARSEGKRGPELNKRMAEILHNTKEIRTQAEIQAQREGLKGTRARRRVYEIMEQARPESLVRQAADYGRFATYNQEPEGVLGVFARGIAQVSRQFPPLRLLIPFTHVVANVSNNALNYTPWGYVRLFNFGLNAEMNPKYGTEEFRLEAARATLGTLGLAALYGLAISGADDEDPPFMITATGPTDPGRRNQLRQSGWRPYSVKIGQTWWPYQYAAPGMGLAMLGNLLDAKRYRKLDDADALNRVYYVLSQVPKTIVNQSFLVGLSDFFSSLSRETVPRTGSQLGGLARTASSILVPNLIKQIDRMFDPTVYDASTVQAALLRDLPVARESLQPMINVLGEPVQQNLNPFFGTTSNDQLWLTLARKGIFISVPDKLTMIGDRVITPEEYYQFVKQSGQAIRTQLEPRVTVLQGLDRETAQDYVARIVRDERKLAKRLLFGIR